jgi:hypothetical protein
VEAGGGRRRRTTTPAASSPARRWVNTLALMPGRPARSSLKPARAEDQLPHHQQGPALAQQVEGMGGGAGILVPAAGRFERSYFF